MEKKRYDECLEKLNAGELSKEDYHKLIDTLKNEKDRSQFYRDCLFTSALQEVLNENSDSAEVISSVHRESQRTLPITTPQKVKHNKFTIFSTLGSIAALFLFGYLVIFQLKAFTPNEATIAKVKQSHSTVWVERNGIKFKAYRGYHLKSGDTLNTDPDALLLLSYNDGSTIHLGSNSKLKLNNSQIEKSIFLEYGKLYADIQPQINAMKIHTHQSTTTVLGTRFILSSHSSLSTLEMHEGKVAFLRSTDQLEIVVQHSTAVSTKDMIIKTQPDKPKNILANFKKWEPNAGILTVITDNGKLETFASPQQFSKSENLHLALNRIEMKKLKIGQKITINYLERGFKQLVNVHSLRSE
jgi:hypothetical protein